MSADKFKQYDDYARDPLTWTQDAFRHMAVAELLSRTGNETGRDFFERSGSFYASYFHASVAMETAHKAVRVKRDPSLIARGGLRKGAFQGIGHKLVDPVIEILGRVTPRQRELLEKLEAFGEVGRYSVLKNADLLLDSRRMNLLRNAGLNEMREIRALVDRLCALALASEPPTMKCQAGYVPLLVESFRCYEPGHKYKVEIRPMPKQAFPTHMYVECPMRMRTDYPEGTVFRICAKMKDTPFRRKHVYTYKLWPFEVVVPGDKR